VAFLKRTILGVLTMLCATAAAPIASARDMAGEYEIKAAFIHHFVNFVEWPAPVTAQRAPIVIGLVGDDPFGGPLDDILRGSGSRIVVRRVRWNDPLAACRIVFISASELPHLAQILDSLRGVSTLTVGDFDRFVERGGMIGLKVTGGRVRFAVNEDAAEAAHLKISSKLLGLADVVYATEKEKAR
jgi:hypothetical protein